MSDQDRISLKKKSDENMEKYKLGCYYISWSNTKFSDIRSTSYF